MHFYIITLFVVLSPKTLPILSPFAHTLMTLPDSMVSTGYVSFCVKQLFFLKGNNGLFLIQV